MYLRIVFLSYGEKSNFTQKISTGVNQKASKVHEKNNMLRERALNFDK